MSRRNEDIHAAIGLIGLPNSGKTAFIYATCVSHQQCPGWRFTIADTQIQQYIAGLSDPGGGSRALWKNTAGHLPHRTYKLFNARRRGLPRFLSFLRPALPLSVPDMPGELILKVAGRRRIADASDQQRVDQLIAHLRECSGLICLIDPTLPDGEVAAQAEDITKVIAKILEKRRSRERLALSIALTKFDVLVRDPKRSTISLPESECLRLAYVRSIGRQPAAAGITVSNNAIASYTLADAEGFRGPRDSADPEHDKAVVWDYLNSQLPAVARAARAWDDDGRATVRAYMISNWGKPAPRQNGEELVPFSSEIEPIRLMEPVRSVLDRVGEYRRNRRITRWLAGAAAIIVLALLAGPLSVNISTWYANSRIDKGQTHDAEYALKLIEYHPIVDFDRQWNPRRLDGLRDANYRLAHITAEGARDDADYEAAFADADRALRLEPDSDEVLTWRDNLLVKHVRDRVKAGHPDQALRLLEVSAGSLQNKPVVLPALREAFKAFHDDCRTSALALLNNSPASAATKPADPASSSGESRERQLDKVDVSLQRLAAFLQSLRHAQSIRSEQGGVIDDATVRFVHAATARSETTAALLALARDNDAEALKHAETARNESVLVGGGAIEAMASVADAQEAWQRVGSRRLQKALDRLDHSALSATPEQYARLLEDIRSCVTTVPCLVHRADAALAEREGTAFAQLRDDLTRPLTPEASARFKQNLVFLKAIIEVREEEGGREQASGPSAAVLMADALFQYSQIEQGLKSGILPAPSARQATVDAAALLEKGPVSVDVGPHDTWVVSRDVSRSHDAADSGLANFCRRGIEGQGIDDKQLDTAIQLAAEVEPASDVLKQSERCARLCLAVSRETLHIGLPVPSADMVKAWADVESMIEQPDIQALVATTMRRLLRSPDKIENAFALRSMLVDKAGDSPSKIAAIQAARADLDNMVAGTTAINLLPDRRDALIRAYLDDLGLDSRAPDLLIGLVQRARMPDAPSHLTAVWKDLCKRVSTDPRLAIGRERLFETDLKTVQSALLTGIQPQSAKSVVPTGLIAQCKDLGAAHAKAALEAAERLEITVRKYDMLLVLGLGEAAQGEQPKSPFYLARDEFSVDKYVELVGIHRGALAFSSPLGNRNVGIDADGKLFGYDPNLTRHNDVTLPVSAIQFDMASKAASAAGGRLPTAGEWLAALPDQERQPIAEQVTKDVFNSPLSGKELGDSGDQTRDGHRGMYRGVREWVTTTQTTTHSGLMGSSWYYCLKAADLARPTQPNSRLFPGLDDVGFRLAADVVPSEFDQYAQFISSAAAVAGQ